MNPWLIHPTWQSHASFFREIQIGKNEKTEFLRYHHLTSALYFGISVLEAFLNEKMREHMEAAGASQESVFETLRKTQFSKKFKRWPSRLTKKEIQISTDLKSKLLEYNDIRGHLTHPKTRGHDIYEKLDDLDFETLFLEVNEYLVNILEGMGVGFPYWLLGWNYVINDGTSISPGKINDGQFLHSLESFGIRTNAYMVVLADRWQKENMSSWEGYKKLWELMKTFPDIEPPDPDFEFKPRLCKKWWDLEYSLSIQLPPTEEVSQPYFAGTAVVRPKVVWTQFHKEKRKDD